MDVLIDSSFSTKPYSELIEQECNRFIIVSIFS